MAETIRDVIIKIRIQQEKSKLEPPDTSAFRQAIERASRPTTDGGTATATSAEREAEKAMQLAERTAAYVDKIDETNGQRIVNRAQRNAAARAQAEAQALAASRQTLESFSAIGEGALRASRGVAFLTASTEQDLRVALQYVAGAQGVLDVFAGMANVTKGVMSARQALTAATTAATAAEVAFSRAGQATIATSAGAAVSTNALGAAAAAAAAPLAVLAGAYALISGAAEEVNRVSRESTREIELQSKWLNDAGRAWETYAERTERAGAAISAAREQFQVAMDTIDRAGNRPGATAEDQINAIRNETFRQNSAINDAEGRGQFGAGALGRRRADELQNENTRKEQEAIQAIREKQTAELQRQRDLAREALETAKRTVEEEKNRLASLEERIGRLSQGERERLKGIAGRVGAGGQLSEAEARFLDQTGVGGAQASAFFRRRGQQGGAAEILGGLGETKGLDQANANLRSRLASEGEALKEMEDELANSLKDRQRSYDRITELIGEALQLKTLVQRLEKEIEKQGKTQTAKGLNGN